MPRNGFVRNLSVLLLLIVLVAPSAAFVLTSAVSLAGDDGQVDRRAYTLANTAPTFVQTPTDPTVGDYNVSLSFRVVVYDADGDNINITWDWGDGTTNTDATLPAKPAKVVLRDHTYFPGPYGEWTSENYTLNVTIDDGNGSSAWDLTLVSITRPYNFSPTIIDILVFAQEPKIRVNPGDEVRIVSNASDREGDPLNWTYAFSDSVSQYDVKYDHTDASDPQQVVWSNITCTFSAAGTYTILLNVSDAPAPHDEWPHNVSVSVTVEVFDNAAPSSGTSLSIDPANPLIYTEVGYELVNFTAEVADEDGDILTATWDFDDGTDLVVQTSPGGAATLYPFVVQRNFTDAGFFNITFTATDGVPGHEIVMTAFLQVNSTNRPPVLLTVDVELTNGTHRMANELVNFTLVFSDPELNPIYVIIDFGDNSTKLHLNITDFVDGNATVAFNHTYTAAGFYVVKVWYTDNKMGLFDHERLYNHSAIEIKAPIIIIVHEWDWWDYTSLGLVCLIPVAIALRFIQISRRRKVIEERGMTYDEWMLRKTMEADGLLEDEKKGGP